jgi:hypothetical protein
MRISSAPVHALTAWAGLALLLATPAAQIRVQDLRTQLVHEPNPVRRGKLLPKLEQAEFEEIRHETDGGNFAKALELLGDYRDDVHTTQKALDATGVDPERKPAGYKELQIAVRESLRQLGEILVGLPPDWKMGFDDIRRELEAVNNRLIIQLFPRQPGHQPPNGKGKP